MDSKAAAILKKRGIYEAACEAGWTTKKNRYWEYPVFDIDGNIIGGRCKRYTDGDGPKYWWIPPKTTDYYLLPGLREAIEAADGEVYIASGEPDVLTLRSAGIYNAFCWFGEGNVPKRLVKFMVEVLGAKSALLYPDLDDTGIKGAMAITQTLQGSGISLSVYHLPASLGNKGDLNVLWQAVNFNSESFIQNLNTAEALEIKPLPPQPKPARQKTWENYEFSEVADMRQVIEKVRERLGANSFDGSGWSNAFRCPFHEHENDHKRPAAHINRDTHVVHCFKCGEKASLTRVAGILNIQLPDFKKKQRQPNAERKVNLDTRPSDVAEQHASDMAAQHASDMADQHASDMAAQHASDVADQHASDVAAQYASDVAAQHASDMADQHASDMAEQHASDMAEQQATDPLPAAETNPEQKTYRKVGPRYIDQESGEIFYEISQEEKATAVIIEDKQADERITSPDNAETGEDQHLSDGTQEGEQNAQDDAQVMDESDEDNASAPQVKRRITKKVPGVETEEYISGNWHFRKGIPDRLREMYLNLHRFGNNFTKHCNALLVYEVLMKSVEYRLMGPTEANTQESIHVLSQQLGHEISKTTIHRGVNQLIALGMVDAGAVYTPENENERKRGRPPIWIRLRPLDEALSNLGEKLIRAYREFLFSDRVPDQVIPEWFPGLDDKAAQQLAEEINAKRKGLYAKFANERYILEQILEQQAQSIRTMMREISPGGRLSFSTPFAEDVIFTNGRDYRRDYQAARLTACGGERLISNKRATKELGASMNTVRKLRRINQIMAEPTYEQYEIKSCRNLYEDLARLAPRAANRQHGRWIVNATTGNRIGVTFNNEKELADKVRRDLNAGHVLYLEVQSINKERWMTEHEIEIAELMGEGSHTPTQRRSSSKSDSERRKKLNDKDTISPSDRLPEQKKSECAPRNHTPRYVAKQLNLTPDSLSGVKVEYLYDLVIDNLTIMYVGYNPDEDYNPDHYGRGIPPPWMQSASFNPADPLENALEDLGIPMIINEMVEGVKKYTVIYMGKRLEFDTEEEAKKYCKEQMKDAKIVR